ncbi:MAG: hypothetical protein R3B57_14945 [Phycisphaerales bacterium]
MPSTQSTTPAWKNRFARPDVEALLGELSQDERRLLDAARDGLTKLESLSESLEWRGIPWRWCLAYHLDKDRPRAFLVPQPGRVALAMAIPGAEIDAVGLRSLPRVAREGIVNATYVAGVLWAEWPLTAQSQIDDLLKLQAKLLQAAAAPA